MVLGQRRCGPGPQHARAPQFHVALVLQGAPAAAPRELSGLCNDAEELIAARGGRILLVDDDAAVDQERAVGGQSVLVVTLAGAGMGDLRAQGGQLGLSFRAAIAFQQHHFHALLLAQDAVDGQQPVAELPVQQCPVAADGGGGRAVALHLAREAQ